ncbi:MAG: hypothetical protein ACI4SR_02145, partial [Faecalibacillus sp.]
MVEYTTYKEIINKKSRLKEIYRESLLVEMALWILIECTYLSLLKRKNVNRVKIMIKHHLS